MSVHVLPPAVISGDERYRYLLTRRCGPRLRPVVFVMLNPSTADARVDDPTIRRCVGFARTWGYDVMCVVNLYALRATDPRDLRKAEDPVGPDNDRYLAHARRIVNVFGGIVVAAWGGFAPTDRVAAGVAALGDVPLHCLGVTKYGQPRHPLYVRGDTHPMPWSLAGHVYVDERGTS